MLLCIITPLAVFLASDSRHYLTEEKTPSTVLQLSGQAHTRLAVE